MALLISKEIDSKVEDERIKAEAERRQDTTFGAVAADFLDRHVVNLAKAKKVRAIIEGEFIKRWKNHPIEYVMPMDISQAVRAIAGSWSGGTGSQCYLAPLGSVETNSDCEPDAGRVRRHQEIGNADLERARSSHASSLDHALLAIGRSRQEFSRAMRLPRIPSPPIRRAILPTVAAREVWREPVPDREVQASRSDWVRARSRNPILAIRRWRAGAYHGGQG
jgi:hypothetical protein